jgi:hypothetical protein
LFPFLLVLLQIYAFLKATPGAKTTFSGGNHDKYLRVPETERKAATGSIRQFQKERNKENLPVK